MNIDSSTGLYFYSALLQTDAAILAIIGLFITFKLQAIQSTILTLRQRITNVIYAENIPADRIKIIGQLTDFDKYSPEEKIRFADQNKLIGLYTYLQDEIPFHKKTFAMKNMAKIPLYFFSILLALNTIGIIFTSTIHNHLPDFEFFILAIIGMLHISFFIWISLKCYDILVS